MMNYTEKINKNTNDDNDNEEYNPIHTPPLDCSKNSLLFLEIEKTLESKELYNEEVSIYNKYNFKLNEDDKENSELFISEKELFSSLNDIGLDNNNPVENNNSHPIIESIKVDTSINNLDEDIVYEESDDQYYSEDEDNLFENLNVFENRPKLSKTPTPFFKDNEFDFEIKIHDEEKSVITDEIKINTEDDDKSTIKIMCSLVKNSKNRLTDIEDDDDDDDIELEYEVDDDVDLEYSDHDDDDENINNFTNNNIISKNTEPIDYDGLFKYLTQKDIINPIYKKNESLYNNSDEISNIENIIESHFYDSETKTLPDEEVPTKKEDFVNQEENRPLQEESSEEKIAERQIPEEQTPKEQILEEQTPKEQTPKEQILEEQTPKEQTPKEQILEEQTPKELVNESIQENNSKPILEPQEIQVNKQENTIYTYLWNIIFRKNK